MSISSDGAISTVEASVLAQQEQIIARGLRTFYDVGTALLTIRDQRLYREDHRTFEEYCQGRWGMTHRNANYLIGAASVVKDLGNTFPILPTNARQAAPLAALPPEDRAAAWQSAVETAPEGKITAAHVEATVKRHTAPSPASTPPADVSNWIHAEPIEADYSVSDEDIAHDLAPPTPLRARPSLVPPPSHVPEAEPGAYSRYALLEQYNGTVGRLLTAARYAQDLYRHHSPEEMAAHLTDQEESDDDDTLLALTEWVRSVILTRQSGVKVRRVK